jgi:hypothetical protein
MNVPATLNLPVTADSSLYSYVTSGKIETSIINLLAIKKDGNFTLISQYDLNHAYFSLFKERLTPVFNTVLTNLKKQKEHLALQLNFEFGNISEKEFNKQEEKYLSEPQDIPLQVLKQDINMLFAFSNVVMDAEEVSAAFDCPLDTAEEALQLLLFEDKSNACV